MCCGFRRGLSGHKSSAPLHPADGCPSSLEAQGEPPPRPTEGSGKMYQEDLKRTVIGTVPGDEVVSRESGFLFGAACRMHRFKEPSGKSASEEHSLWQLCHCFELWRAYPELSLARILESWR